MADISPKPVKITETVLRDAHQSLIATRMPTSMMLPIIDKMDKVGYNAVECWGGATFDACLRFLKEDPWERLRKLKDGFKNTKLQMLFRGQNILGKPVQMTIVASDACVSDEITVYVDKPEPLVLSGAPKESPICLYSTTDITFTVSGGTSPYTYNLVSPSQMPSGMTFSGDEAKNVIPGEYSFSVTDSDGCTSTSSKVKVETYTDFKVAPSLETIGQTICSEDSPNPIKVVNTESYGNAEFIYEWYKNEVLPGNKIENATSAEYTPRVNVLASGETLRNYDLIIVVKDQCSGKENRLRYTLTVNPLPEVNLTANDGCESTTFNADVNGITNNYNFYWSETNQAGSFALGAATKTLSLPAAGNQVSKTYYVKAENATTKCVSKQSVDKTATVYRKPAISIGEVAVACPKNGDNPGSAVEIPIASIIGTIDGVKDGDANVSYTYKNDTIVLTDKISVGKNFTIVVKNGDVCDVATKDVNVSVYTAPEFNVSDWGAICQGKSMENLPVVSVTWNDNVADKNFDLRFIYLPPAFFLHFSIIHYTTCLSKCKEKYLKTNGNINRSLWLAMDNLISLILCTNRMKMNEYTKY